MTFGRWPNASVPCQPLPVEPLASLPAAQHSPRPPPRAVRPAARAGGGGAEGAVPGGVRGRAQPGPPRAAGGGRPLLAAWCGVGCGGGGLWKPPKEIARATPRMQTPDPQWPWGNEPLPKRFVIVIRAAGNSHLRRCCVTVLGWGRVFLQEKDAVLWRHVQTKRFLFLLGLSFELMTCMAGLMPPLRNTFHFRCGV